MSLFYNLVLIPLLAFMVYLLIRGVRDYMVLIRG
jgi:hypothetical protein